VAHAPPAGAITVAFAGDTTYETATKSATLLVLVAPTLSCNGPITAAKGAAVIFSAALQSVAGTAPTGGTVTFELGMWFTNTLM
jgi:hypothetical protein